MVSKNSFKQLTKKTERYGQIFRNFNWFKHVISALKVNLYIKGGKRKYKLLLFVLFSKCSSADFNDHY